MQEVKGSFPMPVSNWTSEQRMQCTDCEAVPRQKSTDGGKLTVWVVVALGEIDPIDESEFGGVRDGREYTDWPDLVPRPYGGLAYSRVRRNVRECSAILCRVFVLVLRDLEPVV